MAKRKSNNEALVWSHLRIGWWSLLVFLCLGIVLETLHGFKVGLYLDLAYATRRHLWTLAHAHGTLLALLHIGLSWTLSQGSSPRDGLASRLLTAAGVLMPGGFLLGGAFVHGGDPGLGILLLPVGAFCLLACVLLIARSLPARFTAQGPGGRAPRR